MSRVVELPLGGKSRAFRLALGELEELQSACDAGPATILGRLMSAQPQAANVKRPDPEGYALGSADPDFLADFNTYSLLRSIGGDWRVSDVRETIRLGLIGGGMSPTDAYVVVSAYVDAIDRFPIVDNVGIAASVLLHALTAPPGEPVGKPKTEETTAEVTA